MFNIVKEIDEYSEGVRIGYLKLEQERKAFSDRIESGELTQDQAEKRYQNALTEVRKEQRERADSLQGKLDYALNVEMEKIQKSYETVTQNNKAELDLLAEAGNADELKRAVKRYAKNPLALLRLQQIGQAKDIPLMISVYDKEKSLLELSKSLEGAIKETALRKGNTTIDLAVFGAVGKFDTAQKAYTKYKES